MDLPEISAQKIRNWAASTRAIREVWLFGSRARGLANANSDVDLAIVLAPPDGKTNWSLGDYTALGDAWQRELSSIVGRAVSLEAILPNTDADKEVRGSGIRLWSRDEIDPPGVSRRASGRGLGVKKLREPE
jgi:predicted nucleotidyltransferase